MIWLDQKHNHVSSTFPAHKLILSEQSVQYITLFALIDIFRTVDSFEARSAGACIRAVDWIRITNGIRVARIRRTSVVQVTQQTYKNTSSTIKNLIFVILSRWYEHQHSSRELKGIPVNTFSRTSDTNAVKLLRIYKGRVCLSAFHNS